MSHVVNIRIIWGKYQDEQNNYSRNEDDLTFQYSTNDIKPFPVYNNICQNNSNNTKK